MAAGHILRMTQARPFVQLKLAVSQDGLIARGDGAPRWVTGPEAQALGHLMRARADAILVGRTTVADDDPELTCRLPGLTNASPLRVVLDGQFRTPPQANLMRTAEDVPTLIFGSTAAPEPRFPSGVTVRRVATDGAGRLDLKAILHSLHEDGITRLLLEAGPTIASAFLAAGVVDEVVLCTGSEPVGKDGIPPFSGTNLNGPGWRLAEERAIGADRVRHYRAQGPSHVESRG